jgi:hypothetical protein
MPRIHQDRKTGRGPTSLILRLASANCTSCGYLIKLVNPNTRTNVWGNGLAFRAQPDAQLEACGTGESARQVARANGTGNHTNACNAGCRSLAESHGAAGAAPPSTRRSTCLLLIHTSADRREGMCTEKTDQAEASAAARTFKLEDRNAHDNSNHRTCCMPPLHRGGAALWPVAHH